MIQYTDRDGQMVQVAMVQPVRCPYCTESFFVKGGPEFLPKFCAYCGTEFGRVKWYGRGVVVNPNGLVAEGES